MAVGVATAGHPICKLTLPNAVPVIFNGLRLGLVFPLFGVIIMLALIGVAITWGMTWLANRLLTWR